MRKELYTSLLFMCASAIYQLLDIHHRCKKTLLVVLLTAAGKYDVCVEVTLNCRMHRLYTYRNATLLFYIGDRERLL